MNIQVHVYQLNEDEAMDECGFEDNASFPMSKHWDLPTRELHGIWER